MDNTTDGRTGEIYMGTLHGKHYIGMTLDFYTRRFVHREARNDYHFHRAIRKYGADAVAWRILASGIPKDALPTHERFWIRFYDTFRNGYNMTEGGDENPMHQPENRKKASVAIKQAVKEGRLVSPTSDPKVAAKVAEAQRERVKKGEWVNPITWPGAKAKAKLSCASNRLKKWVERGQEFLLDMSVKKDEE